MIAAEAAEQRITSTLLNDGTLTSVGLAAMRRESELMGLPLVEVLQLRDVVSEFDVAQTYADLSGLRFLDLTRRRPTRAWVLTLPENVARAKSCLLFGEVASQLVVAVSETTTVTGVVAATPHTFKPTNPRIFACKGRWLKLRYKINAAGNKAGNVKYGAKIAPLFGQIV